MIWSVRVGVGMGNVQIGLGGRDESSEFSVVFRFDVGEGEDGSGLLVDDLTESCFTLRS